MSLLPINITRLLALIVPLAHAYPSTGPPTYGPSPLVSNPQIKVASSKFIGNITITSPNLIRDLGWRGNIGPTNIYSYGDTLYCNDPPHNTQCLLFASNTAAIGTSDPLKVEDFNTTGPNNTPSQFCDFRAEWGESPVTDWGMGISNVVQTTNDKTGMLFFSRNYRPLSPGEDANDQSRNHVQGSGVALVSTDFLYPGCDRLDKQWWDSSTEPTWGDHGAVDGKDGYIYAFGEWGGMIQQIFLARVPKDKALQLDAFEYWNGVSFTPQRLHNPTKDMVVLPDTNQGCVLWSAHHNCWVSMTRQVKDMNSIVVRTAQKLQGPWSGETSIYENAQGSFIYGTAYHPEFSSDPASWFIGVTRFPNVQEMVQVTFE